MTSSASLPHPAPAPTTLRPLWSATLTSTPRGVALARERRSVLAWDDAAWLYLLDRTGQRQAQRQMPAALIAAACADDGSACAAATAGGEVAWLNPDLAPRWERRLAHRPVALTLDALGGYLAVADAGGTLHLFTRRGRRLFHVHTPRPLHHLAFVPEAPLLVGAADFGLILCVDVRGQPVWQDRLVAHVGALAVSGGGQRMVLACFSEGLRGYTRAGTRQPAVHLPFPCRLACLTYDGNQILVAGLDQDLLLVDHGGHPLAAPRLERPPTALALAALGDMLVASFPDEQVAAFAMPNPATR